MFDFAGLQAMGKSIETFTEQTDAALIDIAIQLRITNVLLAMTLANQDRTARDTLDIMHDATKLADELAQEGAIT